MEVKQLFFLAIATFAKSIFGAELPAYEYKVLPNTGHAGSKHISLKTGLPTADDALRVCSSYCSMVTTCDAYYYFAKPDGKDCHLVDYELERLVPKSAMARTLYEKMTASAPAETEYNAVNGENAPNLQPCDDDTAALTQAECDALPSEQVTYYTCSNIITASFEDTVTLISDSRCPGENRLIECELEGDQALSAPQFSFNSALAKTANIDEGFLHGDTLTYLEFPLAHAPSAAKDISRMIIRIIGASLDMFVVIVSNMEYQNDKVGLVSVAMTATPDACAALINLDQVQQARTATSVLIQQDPESSGAAFKLDIFIKE